MLQLNAIRYAFPKADIRVDFRVKQGDTLALMGPSGCGKTTTLDLIAGFRHPHEGEIIYKGRDLVRQKPADRPLSYLFQQHNLFPHLTVWQNIGLGIQPALKLSDAQNERIQNALTCVGLSNFDQRKAGQLSGGQQQRVGLARCLVRDKPLLLLDEPFSALDQNIRGEIVELIKQLQYEHGFSLIISTHQPLDAQALGATIYPFVAQDSGDTPN